jgi:hypothetical protein
MRFNRSEAMTALAFVTRNCSREGLRGGGQAEAAMVGGGVQQGGKCEESA